MTLRGYNILVVGMALAVLLASCKRSSDPAPTTKPSAPLIVSVGGLEGSQLGEVNSMIAVEFPGADVAFFGPKNGFASDVEGYIGSNPHDTIIGVAHSFGCDEPWGKMKLLVLLDPVCRPGHAFIEIPASVETCIVYRARIPTPGIFRASLMGKFSEVWVNRSHNNLPHDPPTISDIRADIKGAL